MIFVQKLPNLEPKMRDALRVHIVRKRQRLKQELEQDAIEKRLKREKELKQLQDAMTLDQIKEQLTTLEKRLEILKEEKQSLFKQLKQTMQVLDEDDTKRKQQQESEQQKKLEEKVTVDKAGVANVASSSATSITSTGSGTSTSTSLTNSNNNNVVKSPTQQVTALKTIVTNKVTQDTIHPPLPTMKQVPLHPECNMSKPITSHPSSPHNYLPRNPSVPSYHSNTHPGMLSSPISFGKPSQRLTLIPPNYSGLPPTSLPLSHQQINLSNKPPTISSDVHGSSYRGEPVTMLSSAGGGGAGPLPPDFMTSNMQMSSFGQHTRLAPHLVGNRPPMMVDMPLSLPTKRTLSVANMNDGSLNLEHDRSLSHKKQNSNFMYPNQPFLLNGSPHQPMTNLNHYNPLNPQSTGFVATSIGARLPTSPAGLVQNNHFNSRKATTPHHQLPPNFDYMLSQTSKSAGTMLPNMNTFYSTPPHLIPPGSLYGSSVENELTKHFTSPYSTTLAAQHYGSNTSRHPPAPSPHNNDPHYLGGGVGLNYHRKFTSNPPKGSHK